MKFGSLFSGIGGFDLGFENAGMECAWQCEIDKNCQEKLKEKFGVKVFDDVKTIGKQNLEPVDVICGGFPCQDVSIAGRREGLAGERLGLWHEFARIIDELESAWVVIENVPGLLSSNGGRDFFTIIHWLEKRGYGVCWRVLDAQYFGVAQRRRRVFIVASFRTGRCAQVLFEREGMRWNITKSGKTGKAIAGTITKGPESGYRLSSDDNYIASSITTSPYSDREAEENKLIIFNPRNSASRSMPIDDKVTSGGNNMPFIGVRRLTVTEAERLQGFPDGWTAGKSDSIRYQQLGNAVAVPVAEWIGERIMEVGC